MQASLAHLETLDRLGCGGILLTTAGEVVAVNRSAERIVSREFEFTAEQVADFARNGRSILKALLRRSTRRFRQGDENWISLQRQDRRPLVLHTMVLPDAGMSGPHSVLILIDLEEGLEPNQLAMEQIFKLTPAEARLTRQLSNGLAVIQIAKDQGVSVATIRTQLSSIYTKTKTRRQSELMMLISRIATLPVQMIVFCLPL